MSQISPPIRILLVGSIAFLAAWFAFLRPGGEEVAVDTPAPAAAGASSPQSSTPLGQAVQNAQGAANAAESAAGQSAGGAAQAPPTAAQPTTAAAGDPAQSAKAADDKGGAAAKGLPLPVAKAVAKKKVLVLYFWNPRAIDDRAVRRELRDVKTHKGKVKVHVASIKKVNRYAPITRGVELNQSPTVVVVDRNRKADALVGFVDRVSIEQAISDALRAR